MKTEQKRVPRRAFSLSTDSDPSSIEEKVINATGIGPDDAHKAVQITQESLFAGPIPSPDATAQYNSVESGLGVEIVRDHLAQRKHIRECDTRSLEIAERESQRNDSWLAYASRGQLFGFRSLLVFVVAAIGLVLLHQPWVAGLCLAAPAIGVIVQFIKGRELGTETPESDDE